MNLNEATMIREKLEMSNKVVSFLTEIVYDESIPVNIEVGSKHVDENGDTQVDVLLEYEEPDKDCIEEVINRAVNAVVIMSY